MRNWVIGIVLILLIAVAGYWYLNQQSEPEVPPPPPLPQAAVEKPQPAQPEPQPPGREPAAVAPEPEPDTEPVMEEEPLPDLANSDPLAKETLGVMIGESAANQYLADDNLISRVIATIDALGSAQVPAVIQAVRPPEYDFEVTPNEHPRTIVRNEEGDAIPQYQLNPANYNRYTAYVEMLEAVNSEQFAESYRRHYPLFQEAWRQMGYADGEFNDRLLEIIDELLATPQVADPVDLIKPEAFYLFSDPELEALPAGQKILIRMGNANAERVKSKLSEIREALQ
jgi:hypothetical protein